MVAAVLTEVQQRAVESIREDGIATVPFAELFGDDALWRELESDIGRFAADTESRLDELRARDDGKTYMARRFYVPKTDGSKAKWWRFRSDDPWLRLGLSMPLLGVVNAYRGEPTQLIDLDNWYTIPEPDADERVRSQQWHRDPWDNHIVKVFIYFNDVPEDAGPFEYVRRSAAGGRHGHLWPWEPKGIYPPQDEFEAAIPAEDRLTVTGPAGTVIFCDTSGFHRGGWARSRARVLSHHTYTSPRAKVKKRFRVDWASDRGDLSAASWAAIAPVPEDE
jgi:hypothetical protein